MANCGPSGNGLGPSFPYMGNHTEMLDLQRHGVGAIIVPQFFSSGWWGDASPIPPGSATADGDHYQLTVGAQHVFSQRMMVLNFLVVLK